MRVEGKLNNINPTEFFMQVFKYSPEWVEIMEHALEEAKQCQQ